MLCPAWLGGEVDVAAWGNCTDARDGWIGARRRLRGGGRVANGCELTEPRPSMQIMLGGR